MAAFKSVLIASLLLFALCSTVLGDCNVNWVLYKQCDDAWGSDPLGTSSYDTICSAGCAMSSVSMILATDSTSVAGNTANPGSLNKWLTGNNGYVDTDLIIWNSVASLGGVSMQSYVDTLSIEDLQSTVDNCQPIVANVRDGTHWVLITGYDANNESVIYVNDPGFEQTYYDYYTMLKFVVYTPVNSAPAHQERVARLEDAANH
eukprot:TRINITY_DN9207_c0_g1_i1.p1 TRINITY_DN9207_c0_g1~~TRINITY_DN9207_c0_g1_i1.p1  ORF type:complete len:231 (+),score=45.05 TRINITY_DN9207_c0_g1_i1:82-693(+)